MNLTIRSLTVEDLDHFVRNYNKNIEHLEYLSQEIAKREAQIERSAGSVLKMVNDKSVSCATDRSIHNAKLITEISSLQDARLFTQKKLEVVDRLYRYYKFIDINKATIINMRMSNISFDKIAVTLFKSKKTIYDDLQDCYKFAKSKL